jgi:hypothetical protein
MSRPLKEHKKAFLTLLTLIIAGKKVECFESNNDQAFFHITDDLELAEINIRYFSPRDKASNHC